MGDFGLVVEAATDAVSHEILDDGAALAFRELLNCGSDITQAAAGSDLCDPQFQAPASDFRDALRIVAQLLADIKGGGGVAVEAAFDLLIGPIRMTRFDSSD